MTVPKGPDRADVRRRFIATVLVLLASASLAIAWMLSRPGPPEAELPRSASDAEHEAGRRWAAEQRIGSIGDCTGDTVAFVQGCIAEVSETHPVRDGVFEAP